MKAFKLLSSLTLAALLLGSCASDEIMTNTPAEGGSTIHLRLGGAAKTATASRAGTIAAEENERAVNTLHAVLFDTHKGFYKTIEARLTGDNEYDILVEDDATYDVWFVANADEDLLTKLNAIPAETQAPDAIAYMQTVFATQAPESFVMRSNNVKRVTTTITKTENLGTVDMVRMTARFDIVNRAEGVTVTKITFNNRAVKSTLYVSDLMPEEEGWFETKEYIPEGGLVGDKDPEKASAYSYRNTSMEEESLPTLTLEYTETGEDGNTVTREHVVKFIDPNAPDNKPLAIHQNRLYTITLTKAYKLQFDLTVDDWNEDEIINVPDLPIELPADVQDELNKQLMVYDLFADYNVATLNTADKTATFQTEFLMPDANPAESYFKYSDLKAAGLTANNATIEIDGQKYRMPTYGELALLVPYDYVADQPNENELPHNLPTFIKNNTTLFSPDAFQEIVYMKNKEDNMPLTTEDFSDESVAFKGESQLYMGVSFRAYSTGTMFTNDPEATLYAVLNSCYGVRFKGTKQYSAYCWQPAVFEGNVPYLSIKIKALPEDADITAYDIADNVTFWKDNYIEVKMPYTGANYTTGINNFFRTYYSSSTLVPGKPTQSYTLGVTSTMARVFCQPANSVGFPLRLVKVKDAAEVQE